MVFTSTGVTIVTGSIAERMQIFGYVIYSFLFSGWIYQIIVHWCWHRQGWLNAIGFMDVAGSGVVHVSSGISGLLSKSI